MENINLATRMGKINLKYINKQDEQYMKPKMIVMIKDSQAQSIAQAIEKMKKGKRLLKELCTLLNKKIYIYLFCSAAESFASSR